MRNAIKLVGSHETKTLKYCFQAEVDTIIYVSLDHVITELDLCLKDRVALVTSRNVTWQARLDSTSNRAIFALIANGGNQFKKQNL